MMPTGSLRLADFTGSFVALITPFKNGAIDEAAYRALIEWQIGAGTDGFVPCGTTGESSTLSHAEHSRLVEICVETAAGRALVIAGAGSNATAEAVYFVQHAEQVGADAGLVVTPYYNKPTQAGLSAHYTHLNGVVSSLPLFIYNIPSRCGVDMDVATMAELAKLEHIVGVKDATADLARVSAQRLACGADFIQLSGEDATALGFNAQGGRGCISVTANIAPKLCADFQNACRAGDYAKAGALHDTLMPLHDAMFCESSPSPVKYAAHKLGLCTQEMRLPLLPASSAARKQVDAVLRQLDLIST